MEDEKEVWKGGVECLGGINYLHKICIGEAPIWEVAYEVSEASRELPAGLEMTREAGLPF